MLKKLETQTKYIKISITVNIQIKHKLMRRSRLNPAVTGICCAILKSSQSRKRGDQVPDANGVGVVLC